MGLGGDPGGNGEKCANRGGGNPGPPGGGLIGPKIAGAPTGDMGAGGILKFGTKYSGPGYGRTEYGCPPTAVELLLCEGAPWEAPGEANADIQGD
jgi:hypothetical protein